MITWAQVESDFSPDGALRDILIHDVSWSDWENLYAHLVSGEFEFQFRIDGEIRKSPTSAGELSKIQKVAAPALHVLVDGAAVACHFFREGEIEFDFDPRDWTCDNWMNLLHFAEKLCLEIDRPATFTYEMSAENAFLRFEPERRVWKIVAPDAA